MEVDGEPRAEMPLHQVDPPAPETEFIVRPVSQVRRQEGSLLSRRQRLVRRVRGVRHGVTMEIVPLLKTVQHYHPKSDLTIIERAYQKAEELHEPQVRRSGEPYITHPLAVAQILADLGMSPLTIAAALLHDTVEDTGYELAELARDFGDDVAAMVDGVTKLDKVKYGEASAAETVRKMVLAMARDIRVLVIKLGDRLHNMRTLKWMSEAKQQEKSRETLEIYAPLAHRLGMNTIKWELEDLAFKTLYPKMFGEIVRLVDERAPSREEYLQQITDEIEQDLRKSKIRADISGRPKHYYSVYQKMIVRGRDFDDIYDLMGIRVLVDSVRDCYAVLGAVHSRWSPVPGRFKDYIAIPKFNMYQSLHTTVIGPNGKPVEIQIRTYEMHRQAEYGIAAHWRYKQSDTPSPSDDLAWLRQLLDWQRETEDPDEFLDSLRYDLSSQEVFVFTPRGDAKSLATGATPVDFAYAVHTDVGHHCVGARVNDRIVPLDRVLENGDVVEVFTSKAADAGPNRSWLDFVKTPRARTKIKSWFSKERREDAIEKGRDEISRQMRRARLPIQRLMANQELLRVAQDSHYADVAALFAAVGENHLSAETVVKRLLHVHGGEAAVMEDIAETAKPRHVDRRDSVAGSSAVIVDGMSDVAVKLARCCTPVPGDEIEGFVTKGQGISVHRASCASLAELRSQQPERIVPVGWAEDAASGSFLVNIQVEAIDRARLLSDVTLAIADQHVDIMHASTNTSEDRVAILRFSFEMGDTTHFDAVINAVMRVDGVYDAYRV